MKDDLKKLGHHVNKYTGSESKVVDDLCCAFEDSPLPLAQKLQTFPRHVRRQDIARFLAKYELFKLCLYSNGSIVECGVFAGGGLFGWLHFSAILEPYNHTRRIVGFDTFSGFPSVHSKDMTTGRSEHTYRGAFKTSPAIIEELKRLARIHDANRPVGHIPKIELVSGDACRKIPEYVKRNPHLLVSLLYLDFDLYEPTKAALDALLPRVVKGGIVAFDELNCKEFAGETTALIEALCLDSVELKRFPIDPHISYFVK